MFYESIVHKLREVSGPEEAAQLIKSNSAQCYEALCWKSENGTFIAVSDAHIDDLSFAETALLKKEEDSFYQIESITAAWIKTEKKLFETFKNSEKDFPIHRKTQLIIDKPSDNDIAHFTCGCCGKGFRSNVKKQLAFDQDNGYGYCPDCEKYS